MKKIYLDTVTTYPFVLVNVQIYLSSCCDLIHLKVLLQSVLQVWTVMPVRGDHFKWETTWRSSEQFRFQKWW